MKAAINGVFGLLWVAIGYLGLLWVAKRFFAGRYRAETAAAAVVLAFALGMSWPHGPIRAADTPPPAVPVAPVPAVANLTVDVSAMCATARLTAVNGKGSTDSATVLSNSSEIPAGHDALLHRGESLVLRGWAADPDLKSPSAGVCMVVDGKIAHTAKVTYGGNRPDVAAAMGSGLLSTAFQIVLPASLVFSGRHRINAVAVAKDGSATALPGTFSIIAIR